MNEEEIADGLRQGTPAAQEQLYKAYHKKVLASATYVLGYCDPDVEDVAQEVFLVAYSNAAKFEYRGEGCLWAWLKRIAANRTLERIRQRQRLVATQFEELELIANQHVATPAREAKPHDRLSMDQVRAERAKLGDECRRLLEIRDDKAQSYSAISETLKVPIGTVMSRLARCRGKLKALLVAVLEGGAA